MTHESDASRANAISKIPFRETRIGEFGQELNYPPHDGLTLPQFAKSIG
jgi:hypothetical protein